MDQPGDAGGADLRPCPLCREEIRSDAARCKHCQGWVGPSTGGHGGECPFCREEIHPEAIRCKHCHADLQLGRRRGGRRHGSGGCSGCGGTTRRRLRSGIRGELRSERSADAAPGIRTGPTYPGSGCPWWIDDHGWFGILVEWDDGSCTYEEY